MTDILTLFIICPLEPNLLFTVEDYMTERTTGLVDAIRHTAPYINTHRGKTFVIFLPDCAIESDNYPNIINDIGLLCSTGIKVVIIYGLRHQIDNALAKHSMPLEYHNAVRITSQATLKIIKQTAGLLQFDIISRLSMSLANTYNSGSQIQVVSGNFVFAKPYGITEGIDYCHTGRIRRINGDGINKQLLNNNVVLLGPIGVSVIGESFNLPSDEIAAEVAIQLQADKLISFSNKQGFVDKEKNVIADLLPDDAERYLAQTMSNGYRLSTESRFLNLAAHACRRGVHRCHIVSYHVDGALLQELFSRDGIGTQVSMAYSEQIRPAKVNDVAGILELIKPLQEDGILIPRYHEQLERDINQFIVIERDNVKIGCAALNPFEEDRMGEMACVAIHPNYRNSSRGDLLLQKIIEKAKQNKLETLFVLTTQSIHWFQERGFVPASIDDLPIKKKERYNYQRNSKILTLQIKESG